MFEPDPVAERHRLEDKNPFERFEADMSGADTEPPEHMSEEAKGWDFCYTSKPADKFKLVVEDGDARVKCRDCDKIPAFIGDEGCEAVNLTNNLVVSILPHQCSCNPMLQWGCDCWAGYELKLEPQDTKSMYPADMLRDIEAQYGKENLMNLLQAIGGRVVGEFARQVRMEANTMGCGPSAEGIRNCVYNFVADAEKSGPWPKAMINLFRP